MAEYRIDNIEDVTLNGQPCILFSASRLEGQAYIYCGRYRAPAGTAHVDLWQHVIEHPDEPAGTYFAALGRKGGRVRGGAKAAASRANGARPKRRRRRDA